VKINPWQTPSPSVLEGSETLLSNAKRFLRFLP
jgi:hypothetical protein